MRKYKILFVLFILAAKGGIAFKADAINAYQTYENGKQQPTQLHTLPNFTLLKNIDEKEEFYAKLSEGK